MYTSNHASPIEESNASVQVRKRANPTRSVGVEAAPTCSSPWKTVAQFSSKHEAFPENSVRAHIAAAVPRKRSSRSSTTDDIPANGLAPAILRIGRRVLINEPRFLRWAETGSCEGDGDVA